MSRFRYFTFGKRGGYLVRIVEYLLLFHFSWRWAICVARVGEFGMVGEISRFCRYANSTEYGTTGNESRVVLGIGLRYRVSGTMLNPTPEGMPKTHFRPNGHRVADVPGGADPESISPQNRPEFRVVESKMGFSIETANPHTTGPLPAGLRMDTEWAPLATFMGGHQMLPL